jgi:hypothetical protein
MIWYHIVYDTWYHTVYMISYSISYIISYIYYRLPILTACPALSLQQPILPGHRALMQVMAATIQTEKWIQTRHMTRHQIITSALSRTYLGAPPLIPCFICCNSHTTIPNSFKDDWRLGSASADTQLDRGNGSRLYKVNIWMWSYGRGSPGWCP